MSRYSAVRRQGEADEGKLEPKVLDYCLMSRYTAVKRQGEADEGQLEPKY